MNDITIVSATQGLTVVNSVPAPVVVAALEREVVTVQVGTQGPPGRDGARVIQHPAASAIGGHRAVVLTAAGIEHADPTDPAHAGRVLGITTGASAAGATVNITDVDVVDEPSWNWAVGQPVLVGPAGTLVQSTANNFAFAQIVGFPVTPTRLFVQLRDPITLGA